MTPLDFNPYAAPAETSELGDEYSRPAVYPLATLGQRFAGNLIDSIAIAIPFAFAYVPLLTVDPTQVVEKGEALNTKVLGMLGLASAVVLLIGLVQCVMISKTGQTIGKRIAKTKIVRLDGSNPGFLYGVFLRSFVGNLAVAIPTVGGIYSLVDALFVFRRDRRTIRDHIAGTRVIQI